MTRNFFLSALSFFLSISSSFSQVICNEDFSKGLDWLTKNETGLKIDKTGGTYNWDKKTTSWFASWKPLDFLQSNNYLISFKLNHDGGADNYGSGIVFGLQDVNNFYTLQITSNGYYLLSNVSGGNWVSLIDWTQAAAIKTGNNVWNEVAIEKNDGNWQVIINGQRLGTTPAKSFYGNNIGFIAVETQQLKFDDLKVELTGESQSASTSNSLFEETFSDNRNNWDVTAGATSSRSIGDGVFKFSRTAKEGNTYTMNSPNVVFTGDFSVSADVTHQSGTKNFGYGILFGAQDGNNNCAFLITANGSYLFYVRYHGNGIDKVIQWTESTWINKGNETNRLMVKKVGGSFELYINNHSVETIGAEKILGNEIGFSVESDQEVWFDNLTVNVSQTVSNRNVLVEEYFNNSGAAKFDCDQNNQLYSSGITNAGEYAVHVYQLTDYKCTYPITSLDVKKDYDVSVKLEISSDTTAGGLVWGYVDENNYYAFVIVGQSYEVVRVVGGEIKTIGGDNPNLSFTNFQMFMIANGIDKNPFLHKEINRGMFAANNLRLEVRNGTFNVIINGNTMTSIAINANYPPNIGFMASNPGEVIFDNFKVEQ